MIALCQRNAVRLPHFHDTPFDPFVYCPLGYTPVEPDEVVVEATATPNLLALNGWVYMLKFGGEIMYVGGTTGPLRRRLRQHARSESPVSQRVRPAYIDRFTAWHLPLTEVWTTEAGLIRKHQPPCNIAGTERAL